MWPTHASEKNKTFFESLQPPSKLNENKPFTLSVLSKWLTHLNEKSRIIFGPSQAPYKLNQNKSVPGQKKSHP
jgi:hypothetical protein